MKRLDLILNGKGGVGKSFFAVNFIQYLKDQQIQNTAIDTDNENSTLKRFHPEARFVNLANARELDELVAAVETVPLVVVDCRAAATDLFLPSEAEIFLAGEAADVDAAAAALIARGVAEVVVKRGARGATRYASGCTLACPAFAVTEIDPTGAGDCFGASYVTARRLGYGPEAALRLAAAAGARNVTLRGPMEGTSTLAELHELMSSAGGA